MNAEPSQPESLRRSSEAEVGEREEAASAAPPSFVDERWDYTSETGWRRVVVGEVVDERVTAAPPTLIFNDPIVTVTIDMPPDEPPFFGGYVPPLPEDTVGAQIGVALVGELPEGGDPYHFGWATATIREGESLAELTRRFMRGETIFLRTWDERITVGFKPWTSCPGIVTSALVERRDGYRPRLIHPCITCGYGFCQTVKCNVGNLPGRRQAVATAYFRSLVAALWSGRAIWQLRGATSIASGGTSLSQVLTRGE